MEPKACESEQRMRIKTATQRAQAPGRERRIKAAWLRLWKAVYPNTPPPTEGRGGKSEVRRSNAGGKVHGPPSPVLSPAAVRYLSRFLCAGLALALLVSGCAGPRPLKGGKATTTRNQAGVIQQSVAQGENASQSSKQDQETIKVRTYTLPAATRIEQCQIWEGERPREPKHPRSTSETRAREDARPPGSQQPSTLNSQPSTAYVLTPIFHKPVADSPK